MSRIFAYVRVSTAEQTTENQIAEIKRAGFDVAASRIVSDTVSGSSSIEQRKGFIRLLDRLEADDALIVTKMDRLGRNAMDVAATVARLAAIGVRVHCLQLGGADLTSPAGKMIMGMLNTFAEFERDLIIERTRAGLERAKAAGVHLGREPSLDQDQRAEVRRRLLTGDSVSAVARDLGTSRATIIRARKAA
jgi:putative DNA-invertase from lambdoid prophage Rac